MLNRKEIADLKAIKSDDSYFVSCYLNVDPVVNKKGDYFIHFKNMMKNATEELGKDVLKKIMPDMQKIETFILNNKRDFKKGLAIISSSGTHFWKEFHFSIGFKNDIIIDRLPFIKPLLGVVDRYRKYAVLILDKESARLFVVYLGEIEEYREIYTENVPGKHKKGGWFSLSERSFERHIDYHVQLHIKDVLRNLEDMLASGDVSRLVVGGTEEAVTKAKSLFPRRITEKIIGFCTVSLAANINEIRKKAHSVIADFENEEKNSHVDDLFTKTMKKENAVLGIDNVLSALHEGRVMKLLFIKDYRDSGYSCSECGFLTSQKADRCPYCTIDMERIDYIVDLAAQKALEQGAEVEMVEENTTLQKNGSIGAFLRY